MKYCTYKTSEGKTGGYYDTMDGVDIMERYEDQLNSFQKSKDLIDVSIDCIVNCLEYVYEQQIRNRTTVIEAIDEIYCSIISINFGNSTDSSHLKRYIESIIKLKSEKDYQSLLEDSRFDELCKDVFTGISKNRYNLSFLETYDIDSYHKLSYESNELFSSKYLLDYNYHFDNFLKKAKNDKDFKEDIIFWKNVGGILL